MFDKRDDLLKSVMDREQIEFVFDTILNKDYVFKCNRNTIPSSNGSPHIIRLSKDVRNTLDSFVSDNCGDNYNSNENLIVVTNDGDVSISVDGDDDSVSLSDDQLSQLSNSGVSYHMIHNHPHSDGGYGGKMLECLSTADIYNCIGNDWCSSVIAVNGRNSSKMILMKSKDFHNDFEVESRIMNEAYKLNDKYFDYVHKWESETRKVWENDESNGGVIAREVLSSLPKGTKGAINKVHERYEEIAMGNIGSFNESIGDIRSNLNKYGLDISIEV